MHGPQPAAAIAVKVPVLLIVDRMGGYAVGRRLEIALNPIDLAVIAAAALYPDMAIHARTGAVSTIGAIWIAVARTSRVLQVAPQLPVSQSNNS